MLAKALADCLVMKRMMSNKVMMVMMLMVMIMMMMMTVSPYPMERDPLEPLSVSFLVPEQPPLQPFDHHDDKR